MSWVVKDLELNANSIHYLVDLDANKYIDIIYSNDGKLNVALQSFHSNSVVFESSALDIPGLNVNDIVKVYATSLNADEFNDLVIITQTNIICYEATSLTSYKESSSKPKIDITSKDKVVVRDINYDGVSEIFLISNSKLKIYTSDPNTPLGNYNIVELDNVVDILFIDSNGDCKTDLFVQTDSGYTIYQLNPEATKSNAPTFDQIYSEIGKSTTKICNLIGIADFDRNGSLDVLYDDCNSLMVLKNTMQGSTTCLLEDEVLGASFTSQSVTVDGYLIDKSNTFCFGDYNSDSFIDIFYLYNKQIYMLENLTNFKFKQTKLENSFDQFSCFDYNHNGFFNLLVTSSGKLQVLQDSKQVHNYFLKLSGLIDCPSCPSLPPFTFSNFKFYMSDEYGNKHGMAISHSNIHLSLPYEWIGLGSITNYIPQLSMANLQVQTIDGIIPNSHLYFFNSQILLYMKMGDAFIVIAVLIASTVLLMGLIIYLQLKENKEDDRLRMTSANRVLLRGL